MKMDERQPDHAPETTGSGETKYTDATKATGHVSKPVRATDPGTSAPPRLGKLPSASKSID